MTDEPQGSPIGGPSVVNGLRVRDVAVSTERVGSAYDSVLAKVLLVPRLNPTPRMPRHSNRICEDDLTL